MIKPNKIINHARVLIFSAIFIFGMTAVSWAGSYYVDAANGNDSNAGTQTAPWGSLTKVNGFAFAPGDNIYFKAGGVWNGALTPRSGASNVFITYGAYGTGNKPVISSCSIKGKSYIKIQGIKLSSSSSAYPLYIGDNSSYVLVDGCEIYAEKAATVYAAARIYTNSHHNKITNCKIERRSLTTQGDALNLKYNANYNLIEGNVIGIATHYALTLEGASAAFPAYECKYNIIRNNIINNPEGAVVEIQSQSNSNVFEGNVLSGGKTTSFNANQPRSLKSVSKSNIIRYNVIKDNSQSEAAGISETAYQYKSDPANNILNNRTYNNVITNIAKHPLAIDNFEPAVSSVSNNVYKNNLVFNNGSGYQLFISSIANITENYFMNNLFYNNGISNVLSIKGKATTVAGIQSSDPTHFAGNIQQAPNVGQDFRPLQGSPCIDAGDFLTSVTSPSGTGTVLTVSDARFFTDGFGITAGDLIQIGNSSATATKIDYTTNTITLANAISWKQNDGVSLPYNGTKPDIGAFEYGSQTTQTTPSFPRAPILTIN